MDELKRLLIERECERLTAQYCHLVDHGEAAKVADLFTEDGVCTLGAAPMNGREAIRATFAARQEMVNRRSMHVCCNQLVNVIDEDHAEGVVYVTNFRHDGSGEPTAPSALPNVGEYRDTFVRTPEGWRFKTRSVAVTFVAG